MSTATVSGISQFLSPFSSLSIITVDSDDTCTLMFLHIFVFRFLYHSYDMFRTSDTRYTWVHMTNAVRSYIVCNLVLNLPASLL